MIGQLKILVLSELLHRANRETRAKEFYAIKNRILQQYGVLQGYELQFIEGKKCFSCGGDGIYEGWSYKAECYKCDGTGWYKLPVYNILSLLKFGKYVFHQPFGRSYKKPDISVKIIEGYIEHDKAKYGATALTILYLLYEKGYIKRWYKSTGIGWRVYWWEPRNWPNNIVHLVKHGRKSIPFLKLRSPKVKVFKYEPCNNDDLPF